MKRRWYLLWVLNAATLLVFGQGRVSFEATTDAKQVARNNVFEISFSLYNANGKKFSPPSFRDFEVVSGPDQSVSTTIVNGAMTQEQSISYTLLAKKTGKFTIGSATISVQGQKLTTKPVTVEVVETKKSAAKKGSEEPISLHAELSDSVAFVGQQVLLDFKIYTQKNIDSYNLLDEPDYAGLYTAEVRRFDGSVHREIISGVQYSTKILKRVAVFPQQIGRFEIGPMSLQIGVVAEEQDPRRSMFFMRDIEFVNITSQPVQLSVKAPPADAPPDFSGAVGKYTISVEPPKPDLTTDEAFALRLTITGNGDSKRLTPQKIALPDAFEPYDPKVLNEESSETGGEIVHTQTVEYLATLLSSGQFEVEPKFCYFDIDSLKYVTLSAEIFAVNVTQGANPLKTRPSDNAEKSAGNNVIRPIKTHADLREKGNRFWGSPLFWGLLFLPLAVLGAGWWLHRRQLQIASMDASVVKKSQADKVARKRLAFAKNLLETQAGKGFYDEISKAVFGYACDKLGIPLAELTKSNLHERLAVAAVSPELTDRLMAVLQTCEMALFAGQDNPAAMQRTYDESVTVITAMEETMKK